MTVCKLNNTTLIALRGNTIEARYHIEEVQPEGDATKMWVLFQEHPFGAGKKMPLASFPDYSSAEAGFDSIKAALKKERRHLAMPKAVWVGAGALAVSLLIGGFSMILHSRTPVPPAASIPPAFLQGMMGDGADGLHPNPLLPALTQQLQNNPSSHNLQADHPHLRRHPTKVHEGYTENPDHPVSLTGEDTPPAPDSGIRSGNSQSSFAMPSPEALPEVHAMSPVNQADIQKRLSLLSGIKETTPIPGSDFGSYQALENVLPDDSGKKDADSSH